MALGKKEVGGCLNRGNHYVAARRPAERVADSTPQGPHFVTRVSHPPSVYYNPLTDARQASNPPDVSEGQRDATLAIVASSLDS